MTQQNENKEPSAEEIAAFTEHWPKTENAERSTAQKFLVKFTEFLRLPEILSPGIEGADGYRFEKPVQFYNSDGAPSTKRIDLYKRGCFILEAKQGANPKPGVSEQADIFGGTSFIQAQRKRNTAERGSKAWERAMTAAYQQAAGYAQNLPEDESLPPFLIVADIGYCFDIYANFLRNGRAYHPFPDARGKRIFVKDLDQHGARKTLRLIWTAPDALDPSLVSEKITREISENLGAMARSMENHHPPALVSQYLMRCLFTMFAQDTGLLPAKSFTNLLDRHRKDPIKLQYEMDILWADMDKGTEYSAVIKEKVRHFNGRLFHDHRALLMKPDQIKLLHDAARRDWRDVEPAIFGTLLERALEKKERHKLGAHYTPRAYVERLVMPAVIEPLRQDWALALSAAEQHAAQGNEKKARDEIEEFHRELCSVKVLDPACGSGNFLYVALELMKRLEGGVLNALESYSGAGVHVKDMDEVSPDQFLGLEINPRAAAIAEMVLWIGYLQWRMKNFGGAEPPDPVLQEYGNVRHADALMTWKDKKLHTDEKGKPVTRWDGESRVRDLKTGRKVPDVSKQIEDYIYISPAPAKWPEADFIVGNPPFQGGKDLRKELGDGYTEALWKSYSTLPNSIDFVMYWWHKAAELVCGGKARRFGFITTNSITQTFSRRVIEQHEKGNKPLSIFYAVPDHPWVDAADGAAVRISMTVGIKGDSAGRLAKVAHEHPDEREGRGIKIELAVSEGKIRSNLRIGANLSAAKALRANERICSPGVKLHGAGFMVTPEGAEKMGLGARPEVDDVILPYMNGSDLMQKPRGKMVIDLHGMTVEEVRDRYPGIYQHVLETVKPERDQNNMQYRRENWWLFGATNILLRNFLAELPRYIATAETAKHRVFVFFDAAVRPDNKIVNIGLDDAYFLGVLSSRAHVIWALATGGRLEDRPTYQKVHCFDKFPFPETDAKTKAKIRKLAERLDKHRKDRQAEHPDLTLTDMYNVLAALRGDGELTEKERSINDRGLIQVLKELHDELDAAVADAYGWPADLREEAVLENLLELNLKRASAEAAGKVRWLRPEFQNPDGAAVKEREAVFDVGEGVAKTAKQAAWPDTVKLRIAAIRAALDEARKPQSLDEITAVFKGAKRPEVLDLLATMVDMGAARHTGKNRFV